MIKELEISNFKKFTGAKFYFGDISLLIGGNNSGKSTLFKALNFLRSFIESQRNGEFTLEGGDYKTFLFSNLKSHHTNIDKIKFQIHFHSSGHLGYKFENAVSSVLDQYSESVELIFEKQRKDVVYLAEIILYKNNAKEFVLRGDKSSKSHVLVQHNFFEEYKEGYNSWKEIRNKYIRERDVRSGAGKIQLENNSSPQSDAYRSHHFRERRQIVLQLKREWTGLYGYAAPNLHRSYPFQKWGSDDDFPFDGSLALDGEYCMRFLPEKSHVLNARLKAKLLEFEQAYLKMLIERSNIEVYIDRAESKYGRPKRTGKSDLLRLLKKVGLENTFMIKLGVSDFELQAKSSKKFNVLVGVDKGHVEDFLDHKRYVARNLLKKIGRSLVFDYVSIERSRVNNLFWYSTMVEYNWLYNLMAELGFLNMSENNLGRELNKVRKTNFKETKIDSFLSYRKPIRKRPFDDDGIWLKKYQENPFGLFEIDIVKHGITWENIVSKSKFRDISDAIFNLVRNGKIDLFPSMKSNKPQDSSVKKIYHDWWDKVLQQAADIDNDVKVIFQNREKYQIQIKAFYFLMKWMCKCEIGSFLKPDAAGDHFIPKLLSNSGKEIGLKDLGYGSCQLLGVLLKITTSISRRSDDISPTILIEEPESNLHPDAQVLLAEMLIDYQKNFGLQFILETHSDHLLRHLQIKSARKDIASCNINYLRKGSVRQVSIDENGALSESIAEGFYGVASKQVAEYLSINKS